ncbi:MAG: glycosyltransferase family 4 protein [Methanosarcina sp.]|jgi:glycosyltransferase involved in cell wall biosynthesis
MNIGIISERLSQPATGIGVYTQNLIKEMSEIYPRKNLFLIDMCDREIFKELNKIIISPSVRSLPKNSYFWHLISQIRLRKNNFNLEVVHSPENATLFLKMNNQKKVITVHDILPCLFPELFGITAIRYKLLFRNTLKTADKIIAISNNTKKDLIDYFKVPEDKIVVIYSAADSKFKQLSVLEIENIKRKYHLNFPFILYVGSFMKHKNIPSLIEAFRRFHDTEHCRLNMYKLVLVGSKKWQYDEIFEMVLEFNLKDDVIFLGSVPDGDLPLLYNAASLFVYPSVYEGFGLPPLEAMACGCPVITSNSSSLPEVVGDAGLLVDTCNIDHLVDSMHKVLTNEELRQRIIKRGLEQAKSFNWRKCAEETLEVYKSLYEKDKNVCE